MDVGPGSAAPNHVYTILWFHVIIPYLLSTSGSCWLHWEVCGWVEITHGPVRSPVSSRRCTQLTQGHLAARLCSFLPSSTSRHLLLAVTTCWGCPPSALVWDRTLSPPGTATEWSTTQRSHPLMAQPILWSSCLKMFPWPKNIVSHKRRTA